MLAVALPAALALILFAVLVNLLVKGSRRLRTLRLGKQLLHDANRASADSGDVELHDMHEPRGRTAIEEEALRVARLHQAKLAEAEAAEAEAARGAAEAKRAAKAAKAASSEAALAAAKANKAIKAAEAEAARRAAQADRVAKKEVDEASAILGRTRQTTSLARSALEAHLQSDANSDGRFSGSTATLCFGRMQDAALGVEAYVCVPAAELYRGIAEGLPALRREIEANGTEEDKYCMRYVLDAAAGSSDVVWPNGNLKLDCDASGAVHGGRLLEDRTSGKTLADFVDHPKARLAELSEVEVAALRLYTTAMYASINDPLRDLERRERKQPHPLPLTVVHLTRGVLKLRAVGASGDDANETVELYRGMRNVDLPEEFLDKGGTELAPMSTTSSIQIALSYSASKEGVLFRLRTNSSMERGADLTFLSCFPGEREYLFPPLTYLQPVKPVKKKTVTLAGATFTVIEVEPKQ